MNIGFMNLVMYNSVLLKKDTPYETEEGCLSLDGVRKTIRYENIELHPDKKTAVFVYCLRSAGSRLAVQALSKMGYCAARSIGGINSYTGQIER